MSEENNGSTAGMEAAHQAAEAAREPNRSDNEIGSDSGYTYTITRDGSVVLNDEDEAALEKSKSSGSNTLNGSTYIPATTAESMRVFLDTTYSGLKLQVVGNALYLTIGAYSKDSNDIENLGLENAICFNPNGYLLDGRVLPIFSGKEVQNGNDLKDVTRIVAEWLIANPASVYATQNGWFSALFYEAGFVRDSNGIYHARQDCLQQYGGYNDLYDIIFNYATSMDKAKFLFAMDGQDYIFWAWKGDYLNLGAGAEMGIYTRLVINGTPTDQWLVDTGLALPMTLTLNDNNGNEIFSYSPSEKQWWVTGWNPYYQDVQASNLTAEYTVDLSGNKDMYNSFYSTWRRDSRWTFNAKNYTATLTF